MAPTEEDAVKIIRPSDPEQFARDTERSDARLIGALSYWAGPDASGDAEWKLAKIRGLIEAYDPDLLMPLSEMLERRAARTFESDASYNAEGLDDVLGD